MAKLKPLDTPNGIASHYNEALKSNGVSRRDFIKFCTAITAAMALPYEAAGKVAEAIASKFRPPVIWLHFQECTGCTETLLRATHPTVENLVLDMISLDYSETLCVAAGHQVEELLHQTVEKYKGKFILVVEGSIPLAEDGIYCKIAGRTALDISTDVGSHAAAAIAIGSCASWGGVQSASPNPTQATGFAEVLKMNDIGTPVINLPGCPASPYNLLQVVLYYLTLSKLPKLDKKGRPNFAYGKLIHDNCERRPHFDAGHFADQFGGENHRKGWCLYKLGCKGPETYANCGIQKFGDTGSWPIGIGHPCFGCSEEGVGFNKPLHEQANVLSITPPEFFPGTDEEKGGGISPGAAAVAGAVAGAAAVASAMTAKKLDKESNSENA